MSNAIYNVEIIVDNLRPKQEQVEGLRMHIKDLYQQINDGLSASNGVITKGIENLYKEIDATFNKKSKIEQEVMQAKRQIFIELGVN